MLKYFQSFILCTVVLSSAQDWSVVQKYYKPGFQVDLKRLKIPAIPSNDIYTPSPSDGRMHRIDYFADYRSGQKNPFQIWNRSNGILMRYLVEEKKNLFLIHRQSCHFDSAASYDWSACEQMDQASQLTLQKKAPIDWIDLHYVTEGSPPQPFFYPFPDVKPLYWKIMTKPSLWSMQWSYHPNGSFAQILDRPPMGKTLTTFEYSKDSLQRDTLIKIWSESWTFNQTNQDSTLQNRAVIANHRIHYNQQGRIEWYLADIDSVKKPSQITCVCFPEQIFIYDQQGRNVARLHLWPGGKKILALTAIQYNTQQQKTRQTTYLVQDKVVKHWIQTEAWHYNSQGKPIQRTVYSNTPFIRQLKQNDDMKFLYWDSMRW